MMIPFCHITANPDKNLICYILLSFHRRVISSSILQYNGLKTTEEQNTGCTRLGNFAVVSVLPEIGLNSILYCF